MTNTRTATPDRWTLAYRNPHANRFTRIASLELTWHGAVEAARQLVERRPELQVYYTPTLGTEQAGLVAESDIGAILVESGRRVRMTEGPMPAGITAEVLLGVDEAEAVEVDVPVPADEVVAFDLIMAALAHDPAALDRIAADVKAYPARARRIAAEIAEFQATVRRLASERREYARQVKAEVARVDALHPSRLDRLGR